MQTQEEDSSLHVDGLSREANDHSLLVHAYDPQDIERDVTKQFLSAAAAARMPYEDWDVNIVQSIIRENPPTQHQSSSSSSSTTMGNNRANQVKRLMELASQDLLRLLSSETSKRERLLVKIKMLAEYYFQLTGKDAMETNKSKNSKLDKEKHDREVVQKIQQPPPPRMNANNTKNSLVCPHCNLSGFNERSMNRHLDTCLLNGSKRRNTTKQPLSSSSSSDPDDNDDDDDHDDNNKDQDAIANQSQKQLSNTDAIHDDWDEHYCESRLREYRKQMHAWTTAWNEARSLSMNESQAHEKAEAAFVSALQTSNDDDDDDDEEIHDEPLFTFDVDLRIPYRLYNRLLPHQRDAMEFFYRHHRNDIGCVLGDEMGLGKTAQIISFLASLKVSGMLHLPCLIVAPATTLSQWVFECREWHAPFRVFVLHSSFNSKSYGVPARTGAELTQRAFDDRLCDIVLTTYEGVQMHAEYLLSRDWGYCVLDEAHKIRNPDTKMTLACKRIRTPHRVALTGAPIQNRLRELWSLYDFICPRQLGTLPIFEECFAEPIRLGGMLGASPEQVLRAYEAAKTLRAKVTPYMLRRMKRDLSTSLPEKTERVLFCNLTEYQRAAYLRYLASNEVQDLLTNPSYSSSRSRRDNPAKAQSAKTFRVIQRLRRICNHPDLDTLVQDDDEEEGEDELFSSDHEDDFKKKKKKNTVNDSYANLDTEKSSKMIVLEKILLAWREEGHKVLLFSQGTKMLNVLEYFAGKKHGWPTMRMDGQTDVRKRQLLINRFNSGSVKDTFLFLLTTRVGGVGINLTGATRVVIFDPDWNPSTDSQARERAWRLGQKKPVTVYRMIVSGTIEEKIYHRQIFKQFLTNKVLNDPAQRRFFKDSDLRDLFTLSESAQQETKLTETEKMFQEQDLVDNNAQKKKKKKSEEEQEEDEDGNHDDDEETDNKMLKNLFSEGTAFRDAFNHDIVERASLSQNEKMVVQKRAKLQAKAATELFRAEQARVQHAPVDVPTFTGVHGAPPSAAQLIGMVRERSFGLAAQRSQAVAARTSVDPAYMKVFRELHSLLKSKGEDGCPTRVLTKRFEKHFKNDHDGSIVFRELLREIANFNEYHRVWILKSEYST